MINGLRFFYKRIIVHRVERFIRRISLLVKYLIKKKNINPVFVIAAPRTGSYLLLDYLDSHPEISSLGEIINPDIVRGIRTKFISKPEVIFHIKTSLNTSKQVNGVIKLISDQMQVHKLTVDDIKMAFPDAKFIILYRESLLRQYISYMASKETGTWKLDKDKNIEKWNRSSFTFKLDPAELKEFCYSVKQFYLDILEKDWIKKESLVLSYEELIGSSKSEIGKKLFSFLNLPPVEVETNLKKMNERTIEEIVTNYNEVKESLESVTFAPCRT